MNVAKHWYGAGEVFAISDCLVCAQFYNLLLTFTMCSIILQFEMYFISISATVLLSPRLHFLSPQRSFSNADSSVVPLSSSVVNFSLKILLSQKRHDNFVLFRCTASLGRYPCTVKIWMWLNHPNGIFKGHKGQIWLLFYLEAIDNFSIYARGFPRRVRMNCQKMDSIESLQRSF